MVENKVGITEHIIWPGLQKTRGSGKTVFQSSPASAVLGGTKSSVDRQREFSAAPFAPEV